MNRQVHPTISVEKPDLICFGLHEEGHGVPLELTMTRCSFGNLGKLKAIKPAVSDRRVCWRREDAGYLSDILCLAYPLRNSAR